MALRHLALLPLAVRAIAARRAGARHEQEAATTERRARSRRSRQTSKHRQKPQQLDQDSSDEKASLQLIDLGSVAFSPDRNAAPSRRRGKTLSFHLRRRRSKARSNMSAPRSFSLRTSGGLSANEPPSAAALARAKEVQLAREVRAKHEQACLALFAERLPYELQMHVLSFIPIRHLVKGVARANRYYADMVDRYVRGCVWREMRCEEDREGRGNRLIFEAQRPIDTLTTKHVLYFSHFGPEGSSSSSSSSNSTNVDGGLSTLAHFHFKPPQASVRSSSRGGSSSRSASKTREQAGSFPSGRYAPHGATYIEGEQRSSIPYNLPASLQSRLNNSRLSSSVAPVPQTYEEAAAPADTGPARVLPRTGETQEVPLPQHTPAQPQPQQQRAAPRQHGDLRDFTDVSAPNLWREGTRGEARLVRDDEPDVLAPEAQAAETEEDDEQTDDDEEEAESQATTWDSLGSALDAYDWAGPISSSQPSTRSRTKGLAHAAAHSPTYRFQLDALDSFESWCLSLTLQRRERAPQGVPRDASRQVRYGTQWAAPMRWEKRVAEGLDRVFRDFFVSPPATAPTAAAQAALETASPSARTRASKALQPPERVLEFDEPSCVLSIQPHAHAHASFAHPALGVHSGISASHAYLSFPSLADQYSAGQARRVELTFHVPAVRISAARLAAALEDVQSDVQRAKEAPRALGWSTWSAGTGGNWRAL